VTDAGDGRPGTGHDGRLAAHRAGPAGSAPAPNQGGAGSRPLVLHLVTDLRVGGTQAILLERVRRPGPFRHAVASFATRTGGPPADNASDMVAAFAGAGVAVHDLGLRTARETAVALLSGRLARRVREVLAATRPALVHSTLYHVHLLGAWMADRAGVPHVASKEGIDDWMGPLPRLLEARALRRAARVAAVSEATAAAVRRLGVPGSRVVVIPNGIDPARPGSWIVGGRSFGTATGSPATATFSLPGPHLVGVGRLDPVKGWDDLLDALALLRVSHPEAHLDLLGSGTATALARLRARAASLGLAAQVAIGETAFAPDPAPSPVPILVVPSREEGFGLVLLEGMARGMPIVATQVGGIPEVARPEVEAVLVPPRDPRALARAIARVHADPVLAAKLVQNGRARVAAFPVATMVDAYHRLYGELLEHAGREVAPDQATTRGEMAR
jgi:glycosyltransferase involved in cell wall biosynthesis